MLYLALGSDEIIFEELPEVLRGDAPKEKDEPVLCKKLSLYIKAIKTAANKIGYAILNTV